VLGMADVGWHCADCWHSAAVAGDVWLDESGCSFMVKEV